MHASVLPPIQRKPARGVSHLNETTRKTPHQVTRGLRQQIEHQAMMLVGEADPREVSAVISDRLRVPESLVDHVIARLMAQYRAEAAALKLAMRNGLDMAAEAERGAWTEARVAS